MYKAKHILLGMAVIAFLCAHADDYLLYWQVRDDARIDGVLLDDYTSWYARLYNNFDYGYNDSGRIAGARAVFFDASGNGPSTMYLSEYDGTRWTDTAFTDTFIDNDKMQVVGTGGGMYSHFTVITPDSPSSLSFAIELGNWENGEWVTLATSSTMSYNDLTVLDADGYHILNMADSIDLYNFQPWAPAAFGVPEPSSGLLVLIGAGLLALRRRRR